VSPRRKIFDKHLSGFVLGETVQADVKKKLGDAARTLSEEKVTVVEYDDPKEASITAFKKVQFIFFDGLLLNVSFVEPKKPFARKKLHELLGEPDEVPEEGDDEDDEDGEAEIFEVDVESEPMLSFAAHFDEAENLEALSLCAEISEDLLDDDEPDDAE
jgi:hypothetical protein